MPRKLILIPQPGNRLLDTTRIEDGYPRDYTAAQMQAWAADVDRYNQTTPEAIARLRSLPPDQLTPEQQRTLDVEHYFYEDPTLGIKGSLREDQTVELCGGRHRAGYMLERGVDPVPVWVSSPSQRELDSFDAQCQRERQQARTEPPPRTAMDQQRDTRRDQAATRTEGDRGTRAER